MSNTMLIEERVKGQFPISIATSLAIEGLLGMHPEAPIPVRPHWLNYDTLFVNVRTVYRNLYGLFKAEQADALKASEIAPFILEEMEIIKNVVRQHSEGNMDVIFYSCSYENLSGIYKHGQFKEADTVKQKMYSAKESAVLDECYKKLGGKNNETFKLFDVTIVGDFKRTLLFSHYPVDLLNIKNVKSLALLESHTGLVKGKNEWYTKLKNGKDHPRIPFDKMTIQLFGDSGGLFKPYPRRHREKMIELSNKYQWSQITTKERILQCVTLAREPFFEADVKKLYSGL